MQKKWMVCALAALGLAACGGDGGLGGSGSVSVGVTDAPVDDADAVVVTFSGVELIRQGASPLRFDLVSSASVDLLTQQGDQQYFLIQDEVVPAGVYDEVRLIVADQMSANCNSAQANPDHPSYVTVSGVDYPLIVPSGSQSGFKIKGPITVAAGGSAAYTVDFDLRKSLAQRGANNCYNLRPVLRVVDNAEVGTLTGAVDPALLSDASCVGSNPQTGEGAAVYVFQGAGVTPDDFDGLAAEPLTTALLTPVFAQGGALEDFGYTVGFLLAGPYTVAFSCNANADLPAPSDDAVVFGAPVDAVIVPDTTTTVDFDVAPPPAT